MLRTLRRLPLYCLLFLYLIAPGWAQGTTTPEEAPRQFFRAVEQKRYAQAWQSLTAKSQQEIITLVLKIEQDASLTPANVRQLFEKNDITVQRGFWDTFRQHAGLELWLKQRFIMKKQISEREALVSVDPNPVTLKVWKEEDGWKFGYVETFISNAPIQSQNEENES